MKPDNKPRPEQQADEDASVRSILDWPRLIERELWTLHETSCYFTSRVPATSLSSAKSQVLDDDAANPATKDMYRRLKDSLIAGDPRFVRVGGWYGHDRIKPKDAILWAAERAIGLPAELRAVLDSVEAGPKESPVLRIDRLKRWRAEEKAKGPGWQQRLASREKISVARIKQLLPSENPNPRWEGLGAALASASGKTSRKR